PAARLVVAELHRRATQMTDGYAVREILGHPWLTTVVTDRKAQDCSDLRACALGAGTVPADLENKVKAALRISDRVIRKSVAAVNDS
ncbi:hypothetical protein ACGFU5_46585, partial [Streptomyces sp. NPDC048527]